MTFIYRKAVRDLVHERLALLKDLAPNLRHANPYNKHRSTIERERARSRKSLRAGIAHLESLIVSEVTKDVLAHDAAWPPEKRNAKQRERRKGERRQRMDADPPEEFVTQAEHAATQHPQLVKRKTRRK